MNAISEAKPSVCDQLMSRGTFRNRNHFVPRTNAERSSIQSSGASTASSTTLLRFVFFLPRPRYPVTWLGTIG